MTPSITVIEDHYEKYLGIPRKSQLFELGRSPVTKVRLQEYYDVPSQGAVALVTLGLSTAQSHTFREELLFLCYERFLNEDIYSLLASVASEVAGSQHPLNRGEVLTLERPLPGTELQALYVYPPVYLPQGFEPIMTPDERFTHIAWLIPIYESEANWVRGRSSKAFETLLETADPDLMDLTRSSLI